MYGLSEADFAHEATILWHEQQQVYSVFMAMSTQWRSSMNGYTGLDYNVLNEIWQRLKIDETDRDEVFADLQVMELEALKQMRIKQEGKK